MKHRVHDLLRGESVSPIVGTFHGLCNQFLRIRFKEAGLSQDFRIMDQNDQIALISTLMKDRNLRVGELTAKNVAYYINQCKESKLRAGENETYSPRYELLEMLYEHYEKACEDQGRIDFAELMLRTVEVMERNVQVRENIQERYLHVLIDEFQDTNELQFRWMELFGNRHRNITVVGDEDQSIYSWRGALSGNLRRFEKQYRDALVIRLEQNYRSTKSILEAANALIRNNSKRYEKKLWTQKPGGNRIKYFSAEDSNEEARYVVNQIKDLSASGRSWSQFAVLYRTNAQSRNFEECLGREGIDFRVFGGVRFYQRKEVREVLSYLLLIANPNANEALERAINRPPRGIGEAAKQAIAEKAAAQHVSHWEAARELAQTGGRNRLQPFVNLIDHLRQVGETHSLSQLISATIGLSGLREYYEQNRDPTERERIVNLDELISAAATYEQGRENSSGSDILGEYLDSVVLDAGDAHIEDSAGRVQLMTLHSAKGLEFPIVFLTGLDESILPHFYSTMGQKRSAKSSAKDREALEEERRLCYVGITRAQERLYLTRANRRMVRGSWESCTRSRFLGEIPNQFLEDARLEHRSAQTASNHAKNGATGNWDWLGKSVQHRKFGSGVVTEVERNRSELYLTVEFESFGRKVVLAEFINAESGI